MTDEKINKRTRTTTVSKNPAYALLQKQAKQKGLQPEEKAMIAKVAANRGISTKEARQRVTERLAQGKAVGGKGGKGGTKVGQATVTRYKADASPTGERGNWTATSTKTHQVGRKAYRKGRTGLAP